jgi:prepilin-type N-terminal cleavage/methylation domain-containing protein
MPRRTARSRQTDAFTLVELMIVVAIVGILAALAIPAFHRYTKKARAAEAAGLLNKIWSGAVTYYAADHADVATVVAVRQFPTGTAAAPYAQECACQSSGRCPASAAAFQSDAIWTALAFNVGDAHLYMPRYTGEGVGSASVFTASATGDLDCDGVLSTFQRIGRLDPTSLEPTGGTVPAAINANE